MEVEVRRFGPLARQVLGLLQRPQAGKPQRAAFLLCRPFGQEAVRTAPIYRAMSDRLAREGCTVLTFDAHGCGDSPGEPDEQSLARWAEDTLAADAQLRRDAPMLPVHWFGMALGASAAAYAALRATVTPHCIALWEPVIDGPAYLQRMLNTHRAEVMGAARGKGLAGHAPPGAGGPALPGSVLGFVVGPRLHDELQALRGLPLNDVAGRGVGVCVALREDERHSLADRTAHGVTLRAVETAINWMSDEARGTAIVPQDVMRTLLATL